MPTASRVTAPAEEAAAAQAPLGLSRRRAFWLVAFVVIAVAGLYVLLPRLAGLDETWDRLGDGEPGWLVLAVALEFCSFAGYAVAFRGVLDREGVRLSWAETYEITLAGVVATRLLAAGGAGGIALSVWALRRSGVGPHTVALAMTTFLVLVYAVFMAGLLVAGALVASGLLGAEVPLALAVTAMAFGGVVIVAALALARVPPDLAERPARDGRPRWRVGAARLAAAPATFGEAVRHALAAVRARDRRTLGAVAWWGFDIGVLAACFEAFGEAPGVVVLVLAYFLGMLGNLLPLPGGIGGVDGGMIGAFIACGVSSGLAIVAVLAYRAFAFWLPTVPGIWAYLRLRRRLQDGADAVPAEAVAR